jgi:DNA-binding response OmpR family regulator
MPQEGSMDIDKRILVVSDDDKLQESLQKELPNFGYEIASIEDIGEALKVVIDGFGPDLVIVDPEAPALSGIEACLRIRQWSPVPVLVLGSGGRNGTVRGLDLTAKTHLTEPFDIEKLAGIIKDVISASFSHPMSFS